MYFSLVPNISYDTKPISYPFSESEYVVTKNFFRRYKLNEDAFNYAVFFNKYNIIDGETPSSLADKAYGDPFYDWVILLTNNMVNAHYDWPLTNMQLFQTLEKEYDDPMAVIHHYELADGTIVDKAYYDGNHKIWENGTVVTRAGNTLATPINILEHTGRENEKKRSIYLMKPAYFRQVITDFKRANLYKKDDNYINQKLKQTG
tara:strand:+ start:1420 stop:2031 length:612 start_codon:yes stop_codon:yes gene_type:complete